LRPVWSELRGDFKGTTIKKCFRFISDKYRIKFLLAYPIL
jgi:hypothetical protein